VKRKQRLILVALALANLIVLGGGATIVVRSTRNLPSVITPIPTLTPLPPKTVPAAAHASTVTPTFTPSPTLRPTSTQAHRHAHRDTHVGTDAFGDPGGRDDVCYPGGLLGGESALGH